MDEVIFGPGSVPVAVAARVFGKDACWVRAGIITGYLNMGVYIFRGGRFNGCPYFNWIGDCHIRRNLQKRGN